MRLVENWQQCWRWFSVQLVAVAASLQLSMLALPTDVVKRMPDKAVHALSSVILAGAAMGRVVDQKKSKPRKKKKKVL